MTRTPLSYLPAALTAAAALAPVAVLVWMSMGADLLIDGRALKKKKNEI